jgi:hypothetical protein
MPVLSGAFRRSFPALCPFRRFAERVSNACPFRRFPALDACPFRRSSFPALAKSG